MIIDQFQKSEKFFEKPLDKPLKVWYNNNVIKRAELTKRRKKEKL
jgi:hypothetical protein